MNLLNLTKEESSNLLDLRKDTLKLCLDKKPTLSNLKSRVAIVLDYSGSMDTLYRNGSVQALVEKLFPLALQFDDNGEMEVWLFEDGYKRLPTMTMDNYYGYVSNYAQGIMGGTNYSPVMNDVFNKYLKEDIAEIPNYVIFITDGDNFDQSKTNAIITQSSAYPIFWQFVGIGSSNFYYLKSLDNLSGRTVDNANFFTVTDPVNTEDSVLYDKLLAEYPRWLEYPEVKSMPHVCTEWLEYPEVKSMPHVGTKKTKKGFFGKLFG